jgi:hypothetical protein
MWNPILGISESNSQVSQELLVLNLKHGMKKEGTNLP